MELRHLRYFVAVAEAGSMTVAAERRLHTAQPSLSRQIRDLEAEVGATLLKRNPHGIELTAAGRAFLDHARLALAQAEAAGEAARRVARPERTLSLGFLSGEDVEWLPEAMCVLRSALPHVEVRVMSGHSPDIADAVSERKVDVAFIRPERSAPDLEYKLLRQEPLFAVIPSDHRLNTSASVDPTQLTGQKFIGISETAPVLRPIVHDYVQTSRAGLILSGEADYVSMAVSFVASTRGVALLPIYALNLLPWAVVGRPLKGTVPTVDLVLAHHKGNDGPLIRLLASKADEMAARVSQRSSDLLRRLPT